MAVAHMKNLHSIFCKVNGNSNKLFVLLEPHSSFRFMQYRLLTITTFFEIAVFVHILKQDIFSLELFPPAKQNIQTKFTLSAFKFLPGLPSFMRRFLQLYFNIVI